jgi:hypothetical protein
MLLLQSFVLLAFESVQESDRSFENLFQCLLINSHKETLVFDIFSYHAVIVVDVQNDFINGSLAAETGDAPLAGIFAL